VDNITIQAPAKINLYLDVLGRRPDGYHDLKMIMQAISLYDEICISKTESGIQVDCNYLYVPTGEKNIAYKAAKLMLEKFDIKQGVNISIKKQIPVAAGLAGGSSDAAAVMKGISELFNLKIDEQSLAVLGRDVGADVPFCIIGGTAIAEGVGEKLTTLKPFSQVPIVLVKPDFGVSTAYIFKKYNHFSAQSPDSKTLIEALAEKDVYKVGKNLYNALEAVTAEEYPIIKEIKEILNNYGSAGSLMSGSGPTVFGIFDNSKKAVDAYNSLRGKYGQVFLVDTL
jgi:4-diphosphocytidyl-2-C-methyl-D-erythritol kinase